MAKLFMFFLVVAVVSSVVMVPGAGRVYAGGEEETIEPVIKPVEEEVVIADETRPKLVWFILGFLAAIFITAL